MSRSVTYILTALCGFLGTAALVVYFSTILVPLPADNATTAQVTAMAIHHQNAILLDIWLQAIGTFLTVIFVLALVHLGAVAERFWGRMTQVVASVVMMISLAEGTFGLAVIQGTMAGHPQTAVAGFDLTNVFIHVFLIAPSLFLVLGLALSRSHLLPSVFSIVALALGIAFEVLGFAGLFNTTAVTMVIFLEIAQEVWILAAATMLLLRLRKPVVARHWPGLIPLSREHEDTGMHATLRHN